MPISLKIDQAISLAVFIVTGDVTSGEAIEVLEAYSKVGLVRFEIVDVSKGGLKQSSFTQLNKILQWGESHNFSRPLGSKTAFVVPRDAELETAGFFQVLSDFNRANWPVRMFHSLDEAYNWLEVFPEKPYS